MVSEQRAAAIVRARLNPENGQHPYPELSNVVITQTPVNVFRVHCMKAYRSGDVVKGKAVPLQAWSSPEGSRKLRFPDFVTTAQDDGKIVSLTHRPPLPPGNAPGTRFR